MRKKKVQRKSPPERTASIYARFSSSKQREASIEDQLRVCREWCRDHGYSVVSEYCDRAASGRTDDRPEFQRMVANAGESEVVLVYMMDRFSRDVYDAPIYKKRLRDAGCRVVSATESMPDGPEAVLMENIYEAMAAMESAHNSQRTRRGMEGNALRCQHNGVRLFGYSLGDDGLYHVDDAQAALVREAFALRAEGRSYGWIADRLASEGAMTYRGDPCTYGMVRSMIGNEKYVGNYEWGGIRIEGGMPAIITMEEFEMAQGIRSAKRREHEDWTDYALSGKSICGECGSNLVGVSGRGRHNVKYTYYRCHDRCERSRAVRADALESAVADSVRRLMTDRDVLDALAKEVESALASDGSSLRRDAAMAELEQVTREIGNLTDAVQKGMPYEMVSDRFDSLSKRARVLEAEISTLSSEEGQFDARSFVEFMCSADGISDRGLLDSFVRQVRLFDDRAVVIMRFDIGGEPAKIDVSTGSHDLVWLPLVPDDRTRPRDDKSRHGVTSRAVRVSTRVMAAVCDSLVMLEIRLR